MSAVGVMIAAKTKNGENGISENCRNIQRAVITRIKGQEEHENWHFTNQSGRANYRHKQFDKFISNVIMGWNCWP